MTISKSCGSPRIFPMTLTADAGTILLELLIGVTPKKMQKADPGGQYPKSPISTTSFDVSSNGELIGIEK